MATNVQELIFAIRQAAGIAPKTGEVKFDDPAAAIEGLAQRAGVSAAQLELWKQAAARRAYLAAVIQEAGETCTAGMNALDPKMKNDPRRFVDQLDAAIKAAEGFAKVGGKVDEHIASMKLRRVGEVARAEAIETEIKRLEHNRVSAVNPALAELAYLEAVVPEIFDRDGPGILISVESPRTPLELAMTAVARDSIAA